MDNHQEETTTFGVTVTSDGVSTSGISSPQIVLETSNTLSWGINECSSSFQSVSSCETLESYEPNQTITTESPQVIVVPFLADNQISGTVLANDGVHIPVIKECSIRIDHLNMASTECDDANVEKIIELPFSTNCTTDCSTKTQSFYLSDDDSSMFEGFGVESIIGTDYDFYKKAVTEITKRNAERAENIRESVSTERHSSDPILTERILTERHLSGRQPPRSIKTETVKRPRQIQRKISKSQLSDGQIEPNNQSRIENTEVNVPPNNIVKPVAPTSERIAPTPVQNIDVKSKKQDSSSGSSDSDSDVIAAAVDNYTTKKNVERNADVKNNNNKQKELRKLEKVRRKKELSLVAERIRDHWREMFAAARRKQRKKERKNKTENSKYKNYSTKNDSGHHQRKRKRISCSSDSDSTDSSTSSRTSCSSSSSDSDSNDSDTTHASDTSYTSQTSHTRTESDSTDTDSSDMHHRYRHRLNRYRRSPSATSDTSDTSSSDDDDTLDKRRKFHLLKKAIYRKQSKSRPDENCTRPRKRKSSQSHQSDGESVHHKKWKMTKSTNREHDDSKRTKHRTIFSQKQQKVHNPPRSASPAKPKKFKPDFTKRSEVESTSAGAFSVKQCCFE